MYVFVISEGVSQDQRLGWHEAETMQPVDGELAGELDFQREIEWTIKQSVMDT